MSDQSTQPGRDNDKPPPPTRGQRLAAFGFLGAFALTILTVLLTGLKVGAPAARHVLQPVPPAAESGLPSPQPEPSGSSSAAPSPQPAPPASVREPRATDEDARDDAARDHDEAKRKDARKDADDSHANDPR